MNGVTHSAGCTVMSKQTLHSATISYMRCEAEKRFFTYFKKHQRSDCHREAIDAFIVLPQCTKDVGELQNQLQLLLILWE